MQTSAAQRAARGRRAAADASGAKQQASGTSKGKSKAAQVAAQRGEGLGLQRFAAGVGLQLYAVSPADAAAEAFANQDNQVYFGQGDITLSEGDGGGFVCKANAEGPALHSSRPGRHHHHKPVTVCPGLRLASERH
jgi:hypothetical protein